MSPPASAVTSFEVSHDLENDFSDFGSDIEESQIIEALLDELETQHQDEVCPSTTLRVTDIEDYEPPIGALLPSSTPIETRPAVPQIYSKTVRDLKPASRKSPTRRLPVYGD